jgi:hypothetical protein
MGIRIRQKDGKWGDRAHAARDIRLCEDTGHTEILLHCMSSLVFLQCSYRNNSTGYFQQVSF